jgi:tRNA(fMet)-specific endonuclease VapC
MSLRYLLDTDTMSDLVRRPRGAGARRLARVGEEAVCTSIAVSSELRFGAAKKASAQLIGQLEAVLSAMEIVALEAPADRRYAELRAHLENIGQRIGPNDMLIAAHALALDLTVVTGNVPEFHRVPRLEVENWLEVPT